ncbi:hypothetical protein LCGC14_0797660 [marine sediment metagenome]|uniref:Thiol-disulfide oxidoreductase DCC n=1 Tax=marine sediment metagenome TaxID=412755 RepID=A0A0F9PV23_9ZZZZ
MSTILTVFYDGHCPLCVKEIKALKSYDVNNKLSLIDLNMDNFYSVYPHIDITAAQKKLHGQLADGTMLYGLDVSILAWKTVEKHQWLTVLHWPLIKPVANMAYRFFARYRHQIAFLLTGKKRCSKCIDD